ncbi:MAG: hypothetical protein WB789_02180 [Thermoplasmata archaeon]
MSIALAHPYAEHFQSVVQEWRRTDGSVLLWRGGTSMLGVFVRSPSNPTLKQDLESAGLQRFSRIRVVETDLRESEIPVYFDFEGAWSRVVGEVGPVAYPHALPDPLGSASRTRHASLTDLRLMEALARTNDQVDNLTANDAAFGGGVGRDEISRAVEGQLVSRRAFLHLETLPSYRAWTLRQVALFTGRLRPSADSRALLQSMIGEIGMTPFLFVSDGVDVLCGLLSPTPPVQRPGVRSQNTRPVGTLQKFLSEIHITREPIEDLSALADQDFGHVFG